MATTGQDTKTVVVNFKVMPGDAVKTIQDTQKKIENLKKTMQGMKNAGMENSEAYIKLSAALKDMQNVVRANQRVLLDSIREQKAENDSLNALRATLRNLTKEYNDLSAAERNSDMGQALLQNIKETTAEVSNLEHELGDWTRNVGHYASALEGLPGGKLILMFKSLSNGTMSFSTALKNGAVAVKNFGAQLLKLLANPFVAVFMAVSAAVMKLVDSFKKNDAAMTELSRAFAAFKPILDLIEKGFQAIVGVVTKVIEKIGDGVRAITSWIPFFKDYAQQEDDIVVATDRLEDAEREYTVNSAKRQAEISDLRNKSVQSDKYSYEQRKKFLEQALQLEQDELKDKEDIAKERLRIAREEAAANVGFAQYSEEAYNKMSDEAKNKLAELEAAVINATTEFNNGTRRMQSSLSSFAKQEENEQKQRAKSAASARKERLKNEREAVNALQKMWLDGIKNLQDKEYALTVEENRKEIAALKEKLETEKNLTKTAREAINRQIILMEADLQLKLDDLRKKYAQDALEKQLNDTKNYYQHLLQSIKDEDIDTKVGIQLEINKIDTQLLKKSLEEGLQQVKDIASAAQKDLNDALSGSLSADDLAAKYQSVWDLNGINLGNALDNMKALVYKYNNDVLTEQTRFDNTMLSIDLATTQEEVRIKAEGAKQVHDQELKRISFTQKHAEILRQIELAENYSPYERAEMEKTRIMKEQAEERLSIAQDEYDRLAQEREKYSDEELKAMYGSVEEYNNVLLEAQLKVVDSENAVKDAVKAVNDEAVKQKATMTATAVSIGSAMNQILGSMQGLFETMAESDEKYADYATAMAMMQILVSTAISIANAIQGATAAGAATGIAAPLTTPAFITEMVAIVAGAITSATSTLLKAKQQKQSAPKFSTGGLVGNKTTRRKDDSVDAKLTLGEYVIPAPVVDDMGVEFFDRLLKSKTNNISNGVLRFANGGLVTAQLPNTTNIIQSIDWDLMRDTMADAMSEIQPVVSVKEITKAQKRVQMKEIISKQ